MEFSSKCPEAEPDNRDTRKLIIFVESRLKIWIALHDVPWAVEYMYEQHKCKGVANVDPDDAGPGEAGEPVPQTPWATGHLLGEEVPVGAAVPLSACN